MTVQRTHSELLKANRTAIARAVRNVLRNDRRYRNTTEPTPEFRLTTNVKPSWYLLGTDMAVSLAEANGGTLVTVQTVSQSYIFGDVFHFYDRYISHFLEQLKSEIRSIR